MKPAYLTPSQAATLIGISRPAFLKHVKAERIVAEIVTEGNRALFRRDVILAFKRSRDKAAKTNGKDK